MSRVGLNPVSIPEGVTVNVSGSNINIKGPKGELNQSIDSDFKINYFLNYLIKLYSTAPAITCNKVMCAC